MQPLVRSLQLSSLHSLSSFNATRALSTILPFIRLRIPTIVIGFATVLLLASFNSLALSSRWVECVVCYIFPTEPDDLAYPACAPGGVRTRGGHETILKQKENPMPNFAFALETDPLWSRKTLQWNLLCTPQFLPCLTPTPFPRFEETHSLRQDDEGSPISWSERHSTR